MHEVRQEWQNRASADKVPMTPARRYGGEAYNVVARVDPGVSRVLVALGDLGRLDGVDDANWVWQFFFHAEGDCTRLIVRSRHVVFGSPIHPSEPGGVQQHSSFGGAHDRSCPIDCARVNRNGVDAETYEMRREFGAVRWCLPTQRRGDVGLTARSDDLADRVEHGGVGFVEQLSADLRVSVDTQHQLREIVGSDRNTVDAHRCVLGHPALEARRARPPRPWPASSPAP